MTMQQLKNIHVLYVEDDDVIQKQYVTIFEHFFDHLHVAGSALEGLELFEIYPISLVITDLRMQGMDGLQMLHKMREVSPKIPALITSSYAERDELLRAVRLQLVDYLIKPLDYAVIKEALLRCVAWMNQENLLQVQLSETLSYSHTSKQLCVNGETFALPNKEAQLFEMLLKQRGKLVSHETLDALLYGYDDEIPDNGLRNILRKLRKKLPVGMIETHRNGGYKLL